MEKKLLENQLCWSIILLYLCETPSCSDKSLNIEAGTTATGFFGVGIFKNKSLTI